MNAGNKDSGHAMRLLSALLLATLVLTGCAGGLVITGPGAASEGEGTTQDNGRAVTTLLVKVEIQESQADWERAAALLERALRIEPRNAQLWHRLAKIRLQQGRYGMAESLAQKSNTLAKDDEALKRRNAELIEIARRAVTTG